MALAIDVSAAPPPTQAQCDCLKAQGVVKVIVGTSYNYDGVPADRIAAYRAGGLAVAEYQFPQRLKTPICEEWWCDVENPPGATREGVRNACRQLVPPRGVYSSPWMWAGTVGDWDIKAEFPWLKLWVANYGPLPRPFQPFGGFTEADVVMVQFEPTHDLCGITCDTNTIEEEAPPEEEEMKPFLCWDLDRGRAYLIGEFQAAWITNADDVKTLEGLYGKMAVALHASAIDAIGAST